MSFNIKFQSEFGFDQITDVYKTYRIIQSGTATTGTQVSFPNQTLIPLILVRPPIGKIITCGFNFFPWNAPTITTNSFTAFTPGDISFPPLPANFNYSYVILSPVSGVSDDRWAMRVKDASSNILFDSGFSFPIFDHIHNANILFNLTIDTWTGWTGLPFLPRNGSITLDVGAPTFGERYLLLNQLKSYYEQLVDDEVSGTDSYNACICGIINSESSVTYTVKINHIYAPGTAPGSVLYFYMRQCTIPLLTGTVNI